MKTQTLELRQVRTSPTNRFLRLEQKWIEFISDPLGGAGQGRFEVEWRPVPIVDVDGEPLP